MKKKIQVLVVLAMLIGVIPATASATDGNLPGGTSISVDIDDPTDGETFVIPAGSTSLDVGVDGTASVGEGTPVKDTTVVYVIDSSGSTGASGGACGTVLDCEKAGVTAANTAAAEPNSAIADSGVVAFGTPNDPGGAEILQTLTAPGAAIEAAIAPLVPFGGTNFTAAVADANTVLSASTQGTKLMIFITDGFGFAGGLGTIPAGTIVQSFAVGTNSACTGALLQVTGLGATGSACQQVTDPNDLADVIEESVGSTLDSLDIAIDGGAAAGIPNSEIDPDLPQDGPASVDYATTAASLGAGTHEICVTANGADAGGSGSVTDCATIELIQEVGIDIKPGSDPNSINVNKKKGVIPVAILGSATFDVTTIDVTTLEFAGAAPAHDLTDPAVYSDHLQDVNSDGYVDLVSHYSTPETNIAAGDTEACITGDFNGASFVGCDSVRTVPTS